MPSFATQFRQDFKGRKGYGKELKLLLIRVLMNEFGVRLVDDVRAILEGEVQHSNT